jgi:hypothetical protein
MAPSLATPEFPGAIPTVVPPENNGSNDEGQLTLAEKGDKSSESPFLPTVQGNQPSPGSVFCALIITADFIFSYFFVCVPPFIR